MTMALAIDHVQIAMPVGEEAVARRFFGEVLGLDEIAKPGDLAARGGCWFAVGTLQLHLGVEADFRPAKKAHVALATDALDDLKTRIEVAGFETVTDTIFAGRHRFFSHDPFGNRIEFIDAKSRA